LNLFDNLSICSVDRVVLLNLIGLVIKAFNSILGETTCFLHENNDVDKASDSSAEENQPYVAIDSIEQDWCDD